MSAFHLTEIALSVVSIFPVFLFGALSLKRLKHGIGILRKQQQHISIYTSAQFWHVEKHYRIGTKDNERARDHLVITRRPTL